MLWAYTVMKRLLLLALIAVACEAMAQDAKCVSERAAMVETIRAYARSDADLRLLPSVDGPSTGSMERAVVSRTGKRM